jgi:hypothetical protein
MDHTYIAIDFYNDRVSCKLGGTTYVFSNAQAFVDRTGFPFTDTVRIASYEPVRGIYVIERPGGVHAHGGELEEMRWLGANIGNIHQAAIDDQAINPPPM